ncbi:MAG: hypothetical protein K1Y01_18480 [Vicinamibacteria bacterium]|nr:hypothetical protein [Vicinamibacteria bacterium]
MAEQTPTAKSEAKEAPLWPTALGLTLLVLGGLFFVRSIESGLIAAGLALVAMIVTVAGVLFHGVRGLWSLVRGRREGARGGLFRALLYLAFGVAAVVAARQQGGTVAEFRSSLEPGMSMQEAMRRLDALYTRHPSRYRFIAFWGTPRELTLADYPRIGATGPESEGSVSFTWTMGEAHSTGVIADTAAVLARSRQVWFTFRTDVGFVHFFVILDDRGLIRSVSETTGHQA